MNEYLLFSPPFQSLAGIPLSLKLTTMKTMKALTHNNSSNLYLQIGDDKPIRFYATIAELQANPKWRETVQIITNDTDGSTYAKLPKNPFTVLDL